ncbi:MAG: hypothetical protein ACJASL_002822 [Paraglaciecola sp.]|jgi:hypothetical protein
MRKFRFIKSVAALAVAASLGFTIPVIAAGSSTGIIKGPVIGVSNQGIIVTVKNSATGFS